MARCAAIVNIGLAKYETASMRPEKKPRENRGFEFKQGGVKQSGQRPLGETQKLWVDAEGKR